MRNRRYYVLAQNHGRGWEARTGSFIRQEVAGIRAAVHIHTPELRTRIVVARNDTPRAVKDALSLLQETTP